jgi:hypothetical protein
MLGFSHIAWALSQVTKGGGRAKFVWVKEKQQSFNDLKNLLCLAPVQPSDIETNASDYAMGAILTQQGHPVVIG